MSAATAEPAPRSRGNNTTTTSNPTQKPTDVPRGPRKRHEHIVTTDEEIKEFNKGYHAKAQSQYLDPCQAQTKASMRCMDENNYDKRRCTRFFKDYTDCKKKWASRNAGGAIMESLREERRRKNLGITDEDEIKKDTASAAGSSS
ncbi:Mitochondrial copper homeostasis protein [Mortierella alpina]|nr:Mitochondrial copper homeostasis protein [Mortierella alpina]